MAANDKAMGSTIACLENLAVTNIEPLSVQQSIQDAFSMGYGYPITTPSASLIQQPTDSEAFNSASEPICQDPIQDFSDYGFPPHTFGPYNEPYQMPDYHLAQLSQYSMMGFPVMDESYTTPMPSGQPQQHIDVVQSQNLQTKELPDTPKSEGEELVGIGLYDREGASRTGPTNNTGPKKLAQSKELKLEEAWQPPINGDNSEDSSEESEDAEELSMHTSPAAEVQPALYPNNNNDLSDQSFFFSDDNDPYIEDDRYATYVALNEGLQAMEQMKPQPAGTGNILWF